MVLNKSVSPLHSRNFGKGNGCYPTAGAGAGYVFGRTLELISRLHTRRPDALSIPDSESRRSLRILSKLDQLSPVVITSKPETCGTVKFATARSLNSQIRSIRTRPIRTV